MNRSKSKFCKRGHDTSVTGRNSQGACILCKQMLCKNWLEQHLNYNQQYFQDNKEEVLQNHREYRLNNLEKVQTIEKEWKDRNKDHVKERDANYYEINKQRLLPINKLYRQTHPELIRALKIKGQTNRNLRVVAWTDWDKIIEFYKNCPTGYEVDHIIPLQGKLVSGLHVSWNLQYLTPEENSIKGRKVDLLEVGKL